MDEREEPHGTGSARDFIPEDESLPILRDAIQRCRGCGLYAFATQAVFGEGPAKAQAELVATAGAQEGVGILAVPVGM
jgi:DNA polymerase